MKIIDQRTSKTIVRGSIVNNLYKLTNSISNKAFLSQDKILDRLDKLNISSNLEIKEVKLDSASIELRNSVVDRNLYYLFELIY